MPLSALFTFKIGGQAGQGVKSAGLMFSKVATRSGYYIYTHTEYPSLVRGGHNVMQVSVSDKEVFAPTQHTNLLVALNQETIDLHYHELVEGGFLLFDEASNLNTSKVSNNVHICPIPLAKLAENSDGSPLMSNTVALGATIGILGGDIKYLKNLLSEEFAKKGEEVIKQNHAAALTGYDYTRNHFAQLITSTLKPKEEHRSLMVVNGNQAAALGAVAAGLQFAAIYPMTPTSNILHTLAPLQKECGFIYKQPEDELAAINMALGASFAGARSLVATSGGGFCLMSEGYGLAGLAELPVVIIEGMRGAPATGIPTWTEQGDLRFVLHAHQGDFPRIVLAAGDAKETFDLTMQAFNLADIYQTPVLILIDKHICENDQSYEPFDYSGYEVDRGRFTTEKVENYQRFALSSDGISLRSTPGTGNHLLANSDEHDQYGYSNEEIENRNQQMQKRMKKLETCAQTHMPAPQLFGPDKADVTIVSWGSNKGSILQAIEQFNNVNYLHLTWINPFPTQAVRERLQKAKYLINIECNYTAQMGGLIKERTGIEILDNYLKYDGRPIYPEEIIEKVNKVLGR